MAGMKIFDEDEVLDDDAAEGEDPPVATDEDVDGGTFIVSNAEGVGKEGKVEQIIRDLVSIEVANRLEQVLRQKTLDLRYEGAETWVRAANGQITSSRGALGQAELLALTGWTPIYIIPSGTETTGEIVVRLDKGENPNDYRISNGFYTLNIGDLDPVGFVTSSTYDYYLIVVTFEGTFAVGQQLVLDHHGTDPHTSYYGDVPALEAAIASLTDGKQNARPFDAFLDRNYYVRPNREPITYYLQLHNIVSTLLPGVDNIRATMRGQVVHSAAFNPAADTEQVVSIELNATEIGNIVNNISRDTTLNLDLEFRDSGTVVERHRIELPIVNAPPRREVQDVLEWDTSRANTVTATLPTTYTSWRFCKLVVLQGGNIDVIIVENSDLARGNIPLFGRGNNQFVWNSSTRVITPEPGSSRQQSPVLVKVSLIS